MTSLVALTALHLVGAHAKSRRRKFLPLSSKGKGLARAQTANPHPHARSIQSQRSRRRTSPRNTSLTQLDFFDNGDDTPPASSGGGFSVPASPLIPERSLADVDEMAPSTTTSETTSGDDALVRARLSAPPSSAGDQMSRSASPSTTSVLAPSQSGLSVINDDHTSSDDPARAVAPSATSALQQEDVDETDSASPSSSSDDNDSHGDVKSKGTPTEEEESDSTASSAKPVKV